MSCFQEACTKIIFAKLDCFLLLLIFFCLPLLVHSAPDAGSLLEQQKIEERQPRSVPTVPDIEENEDKSAAPSDTSEQTVQIKSFELSGVITAFSKETLLALLEDAIGKQHTFADLQLLANRITQYYRQEGYFLARAYLPQQDVSGGVLKIIVQEGTLDTSDNGVNIETENLNIRSSYVKDLLTNSVKPGEPLQQKNLERGVLLINRQPGTTATINLEPGQDSGSSKINLNLKQDKRTNFDAGLDNYGSRYTGESRLNFGVSMNNISGFGDQLSFKAVKSEDDYLSLLVDYNSAVGSHGLRMGVSYSDIDYGLGKELSSLDAKGRAKNAAVYASYPLYLTRLQSFDINARFDWKDLYDEANDVDINDKRIYAGSFGADWLYFDQFAGGGVNSFNVKVTLGNLDLSKVPDSLAADKAGADTDGSYQKLFYSLSRYQRISENLNLYAGLEGQTASQNLDNSEQLQMGGPFSVRAYPVGEASGSQGVKLTLQANYTLKRETVLGDIQMIAFHDTAHLKQFKDASTLNLSTPNSYHISGWGIGLRALKSSQWDLQLNWAKKFGKNPLRDPVTGLDSDGKSDSTRLWFSANLYF